MLYVEVFNSACIYVTHRHSITPITLMIGIVNLDRNTSIVLSTDDAQKCAKRFSGLATAADDITHVSGVHVKGQEDAFFIHATFYFNVVGMIHDSLGHRQKILLIFFHTSIYILLISNNAVDNLLQA